MQRCPEPGCGYENRPQARFCEKCGQPLRIQPWSPLASGHVMRGGAYRILEPLGKGGMGALYVAADTGAFGRRCVVKELLDYYDPTDPDEARMAQARFETEARLLAELSHPGIPRIYSYFTEAGRHYIVMEYIEGETLERAVTHVDSLGRTVVARPLPTEEVIRHAIRVCQVLEYLAAQPIPVIHHDLKPANLIVDRSSGEVRLVDFGTARTPTRWATQARLRQGRTMLFGTEGYAAPEQYQNRSDPRADVYALAATIYHLLTDDDPGDHPFQFPQLDRLPSPLADALVRALRLEPQRRSTGQEFRQALEAWLIPEDGGLPFVFRDGGVAQTTSELVSLCDRHWADARQHLAGGDFEHWFRARNRHDLVAKTQSARLEPDLDAALEAFMRRLDPRLPSPRLEVNPPALDFGWVAGGAGAVRGLVLRNTGRGYARCRLQASVRWLQLEPAQAGCRSGAEVPVGIRLVAGALPLRRDHQAIITCTPERGAPISVPVRVRLNLPRELLRRLVSQSRRLLSQSGRLVIRLRPVLRRSWQGARWGWKRWLAAARSLLRSRFGVTMLAVEILLLAGGLVALRWIWQGEDPVLSSLLWAYLQALPLAAVLACLLPALAVIGVAMFRGGARGDREDD
jgi:serine/threonine protein kinase